MKVHHLTLTPGVVAQYRETALRRLERYAEQVVDRARPQIEDETRTGAIEFAKDRIVEVVKDRTSPAYTVFFNVIAWLITLPITFLVAVSFGKLTLTVNAQ